MFQFYAGDFYEVFPALQGQYYASEPVSGTCKPTFEKLRVQNSAIDDAFLVFIHFDCSLSIPQK